MRSNGHLTAGERSGSHLPLIELGGFGLYIGESLIDAWAGLMSLVGEATRGMRASYRYRRTVSELRALDDRMLADVGILRGQIPEVARSLANRAE